MPRDHFTEKEVQQLIASRKYIYKLMEDNRRNPNIHELRLTYEIRRKGKEAEGLKLRFFARMELRPNAGVVKPFPGVSLLWYNERVRAICWRLRHDVIRDGHTIGDVKHWHEKQWTDSDRDKFIVDANRIVGNNTDFTSLVALCLRRWNIDAPEQFRLGSDS
jgi:hypothetical protein